MKNKKSKLLSIFTVIAAATIAAFMLTACAAGPYQARFDTLYTRLNVAAGWNVETIASADLRVYFDGDYVVATSGFTADHGTYGDVAVFLFADGNATADAVAILHAARAYRYDGVTDIHYMDTVIMRSGFIVVYGCEEAVGFVVATLASIMYAE